MREVFVNIIHDYNYQISNHGNVIRKPHVLIGPSGEKRTWKHKLMSISLDSTGYPSTTLKGRVYRIHRLIAEHFIPNPQNKSEVNHKNGIKTDFSIDNLEWATRKENQIHSWKELNRKAPWSGRSGYLHHASKPVNQFDVDGNLIKQHGSASQASKGLHKHHYTIEWAIKKKGGYYQGNYWCYAS